MESSQTEELFWTSKIDDGSQEFIDTAYELCDYLSHFKSDISRKTIPALLKKMQSSENDLMGSINDFRKAQNKSWASFDFVSKLKKEI